MPAAAKPELSKMIGPIHLRWPIKMVPDVPRRSTAASQSIRNTRRPFRRRRCCDYPFAVPY